MKNWLLLAEYKDASMLRDKTAYTIAGDIYRDTGLYVTDVQFVEVVINGQYWGLYLLAEQQQVNPNRINITEVYEGYTNTDIGYFLEFDGYFYTEDNLHSFHVDYADNAPLVPFTGETITDTTIRPLSEDSHDQKEDIGFTIKSDIYSEEQRDFIANYINKVYQILYSAAYENKAYCFNADYSEIFETTNLTPQEAVSKVVNIESLAYAYILNEVFCDADIYWSSFFISVDFGAYGDHRLCFEAPWDFDSAFGNKDRCADGIGFYAANSVYDVNNEYLAINPWLAVLMHEEWFQEIIRAKWTEIYDDGVFERAYTMITENVQQYGTAFSQNEKRWDSITDNSAQHEWSDIIKNCETHEQMVEQLKSWLYTRVEFLNNYWHE